METTIGIIVYWGYIAIMEKKMETAIGDYILLGVIYRDNGKENGNCYRGLYSIGGYI